VFVKRGRLDMTASNHQETIRVLLVEDSPSVALQIRTLLGDDSPEGSFALAGAGNLATALELARQSAFDLILLDLGLPDSQGLDTFVEVHGKVPHIPIIVFTGLDDEHLAMETLRMGAQDYIVKRDVDARILKRAIRYSIERKKLVAELEQSKHELAQKTIRLIQIEKMTALGELTAGVAHELNQPLNAIKIICDDILRDIANNRFSPTQLDGSLGEAIGEIDRMAEIIDHMAVYSRRPTYLPMKLINSAVPINGALKLLGQQLRNSEIEIVREIDENLCLLGDAPRLEQALLNIIVNARDAVIPHKHKTKMRITLKTYLNGGDDQERTYLVYEVGDNGVGIPEPLKEKIFDPFYTRKEPGEGTGLGLSVARQIVKEHGGRIEVDSTEGQGSTFTVLLPGGTKQQLT
jgi:signal transduction histidine kinase